jgi:hypothetical protein
VPVPICVTVIAATPVPAFVTRSERMIAALAAGTVYSVVGVAATGMLTFLKYLLAMAYPYCVRS